MATDTSKRHAADAKGWPKKRGKCDSPFRPKIVDQSAAPPPYDKIGFKDWQLVAQLNKVSILTDDYDAYNKLTDKEWRT